MIFMTNGNFILGCVGCYLGLWTPAKRPVLFIAAGCYSLQIKLEQRGGCRSQSGGLQGDLV